MQPDDIKAARYDLNLTVSELAEALRLSASSGATTVREWERGKREISGPAAVAIELMIEERKRQDAFVTYRAGVELLTAPQASLMLDAIEDLLWPDNEIDAAASRGNGEMVNV